MARHNREGFGQDQGGRTYLVSYQPDWFYQVKVTRKLKAGRQSTKTLFRNPDPAEAEPGPTVRTRLRSKDIGLDVEVAITDPARSVRKVSIDVVAQQGREVGQEVGLIVSPRRRRNQIGGG